MLKCNFIAQLAILAPLVSNSDSSWLEVDGLPSSRLLRTMISTLPMSVLPLGSGNSLAATVAPEAHCIFPQNN